MNCVGYLYIRNLFFAQALRLRPELGARPYWIEMNEKVLAHSPALARLGIRPGLPARQARRIAPDAERVEYRVEDYQGVHDLFCHIAYRFTPVVEPLCPGEIFLGLQGAPDGPEAGEIAHALAAEARDLGFEATVALAGSRLAARLLGRTGEPGCCALPMARHADFLANRSPDCLWTVPKDVRRRLGRLALFKVADVQRIRRQALVSRFGARDGLALHEAAFGRDVRPVRCAWPLETVAVEQRFDGLDNCELLYEHLRILSRRLAAELREGGKQCGRLRLEVLQQDYLLPVSEQMALGPAASGTNRLYLASRRLLDRMTVTRSLESVRLRAEDITLCRPCQLDLFAPLQAMENQKEEFKAYLTLRFGSGTLRFCSELALSWRERMLAFYRV